MRVLRAAGIRSARRGRIAALLACALMVSLLAGFAVSEPAHAATATTISGTIRPNPLPPPQGGPIPDFQFVQVTAYTLTGVAVDTWWDVATYTLQVPPGTYRIVATVSTVTSNNTVYAQTWFGNTSYQQESTTVFASSTPVTGVDVTMNYGGSLSGHISGPAPSDYAEFAGVVATAYLFDPVSNSYAVVSNGGADPTGAFTVGGLPAGSYAVEFSQVNSLPVFADRFYGGGTQAAGSVLVPVETGQTTTGIDGTLPAWKTTVSRLSGADRLETAVAVSRSGFTPGVPVVYVANGYNWPDALSAGPAASHRKGALLLVPPDRVPDAVVVEITRLQPQRIVVVGGEASVSQAVFSRLQGLNRNVVRIGGRDRYETSRKIITDAFGPDIEGGRIFVASGLNFPDALSIGPAAARYEAPVLLVDGSQPFLDQDTFDYFKSFQFAIREVFVVGGPDAIRPKIVAQLGSFDHWGEVMIHPSGVDRYDTNRQVNSLFFAGMPSDSSGTAFLANGTGFADALAGVPLAGLSRSPLFLTPGNCVPAQTVHDMQALRSSHVTILGGVASLSSNVENLAPC
ncbi:cell wall-binding repeat-containing protein [Cryobacterium breve]|uniref:Cell wall-binding repeat-containing protein n=1 Tax=Cryobacterium breve TaxID=1259258 RepID=A0ABY7NCW6_9MICO|nr:cell wall-binding repeat-containing protein [Cryobacterium breve]WBM79388.1 cell wall-binding repeat-containing protein [Cryobacterium breve]